MTRLDTKRYMQSRTAVCQDAHYQVENSKGRNNTKKNHENTTTKRRMDFADGFVMALADC